MEHIKLDDLYNLAVLTVDRLPYDDRQLKMMEHLELCNRCFERYCCMTALVEATSIDGLTWMAENMRLREKLFEIEENREEKQEVLKKTQL